MRRFGRSYFTFLLFILISLSFRSARAQSDSAPPPTARYAMALIGMPLPEALELLIERTGMDLFYESRLVENEITFCHAEDATREELLTCLLENTSLDYYRLSSGLYVLAPKPKAPPQFGSLTGLVIDAKTGEPLADASVILHDADTGAASNSAGRFAFRNLAPGLHELIVTHISYEDAIDSVWVPADANRQLEIGLKPRYFETAPVVIHGLERRLPSSRLEASSLSARDVQELASASTPSTYQALNTLLGVQAGYASSDLHVQGGDAGDHQFLLDGAPVFVPLRNGGFFSAFSPFALGQVTVHKAGFEARHGSFLAGSIELEHDLVPADSGRMMVQVDPLSINGRINGTLNADSLMSASWMLAGRTGLWNLIQPAALARQFESWSASGSFLQHVLGRDGPSSNALPLSGSEHQFDVQYADLHAATRIRLGGTRSFSASLYRGRNAFGAGLLDEATSLRETYTWSNQTTQFRYEWVQGDRAFLHAGLWTSDYRMKHPVDFAPFSPLPGAPADSLPEGDDFNDIKEFGIRTGLDLAVSARHMISTELEVVITESEFSLSIDPQGRTPLIDHVQVAPNRWRLQAFVEDAYALNLRALLTAGSRFTYLPFQQRLFAEPRIALRYDIPGSRGGDWAVRAAAGLYRQFLNQFDVASFNSEAALPAFRFWIPIGKTMRASVSYHATAGLLFMPDARWQVRFETFYKYTARTWVLDYTNRFSDNQSNPHEAPFQTATNYSVGGGVALSYAAPVLFIEGLYEYTMNRRRIVNRFGGAFKSVPWDTPYRLSVSARYFLLHEMTLSLRSLALWGRQWGYHKAYYDYLEPDPSVPEAALLELSHPERHRLPVYLQVDAGMTYRKALRGVHVEAAVHLSNILHRKNVLDWIAEVDSGRLIKTPRYGLPFFPTASLRLQF